MRVRLLGRFSVTRPGEDRTPKGKPAQVLKVLASSGRSLHWEQLVEALWPSSNAKNARVRLRNVLSRLRAQAGPVVVRRGDMVAIAPGVSIDAEEFEALARRALAAAGTADGPRLARQAMEHYRGDLLPEDRYAEWTLEPRERLRRRFRALLDLVLADARARGDREEALLLLERALAVEPEDEHLGLDVVTLLIELGRQAAALRLLERIEASMETLGLPVSARWRELHKQARQPGGTG